MNNIYIRTSEKNTEVLRYISFLSFFYKSQVFRPAAHQGQQALNKQQGITIMTQ